MMRLRAFLLSAVVALVAGCVSSKKTEPAPERLTLTGQVSTTEPVKLPTDAVLTVRLLDVSAPDEPSIVLAEQSITSPGEPPIAFALRYRPAEAEQGHRFVLDARIEVGGKLRYYSTEPQSVKLDGTQGPRELVVGRAK